MTDMRRSLSIYTRQDGKHDWRLRADNGEILCQSSQGYESAVVAERMAIRIITGEFADARIIRDGVPAGVAEQDVIPDQQVTETEERQVPAPRVVKDIPQA